MHTEGLQASHKPSHNTELRTLWHDIDLQIPPGGNKHHCHPITSSWGPTKGSCLTDCYLRAPESRSSWSHAGISVLGQGELTPSTLCHQGMKCSFFKRRINKRVLYSRCFIQQSHRELAFSMIRGGFAKITHETSLHYILWSHRPRPKEQNQIQAKGTQSPSFFQRTRTPPRTILFLFV